MGIHCAVCNHSKMEKQYTFKRLSELMFNNNKVKNYVKYEHSVIRCMNCLTDYTIINKNTPYIETNDIV